MKKIMIVSLAALFLAAFATAAMAEIKTADVTVNATVQQGTNSLSALPGTWNFGTLPQGTVAAHRFSSGRNSGAWTAPGPISVSYFPAAPYEIRIYTDHSIGAGAEDARGYLLSGTSKLHLKVWCTNFGPAGMSDVTGPNPMDNYSWNGADFLDDMGSYRAGGDGDKNDTLAAGQTVNESVIGVDLNGDGDTADTITGVAKDDTTTPKDATHFTVSEEPCWLWMVEQDSMQEGFGGEPKKEFTRRRLCYNYYPGNPEAELNSPFNVHLAMDVRGIAAGAYSGTVKFEMYTY